MKGTSTLHVTEATIIAAVQMYLDDQFAAGKSPVVTGVKPRNGVGNGDGYSVSIEERPKPVTLTVDSTASAATRMPTSEEVESGKQLFGEWWQDRFGKWHHKDEVVTQLPIGGRSPLDDAYNKRMVGGERGE